MNAFHPTGALTSVGDDVLTIDLVGPTMADVKPKCATPLRVFTDQLWLLKIDGRRQIAQKVCATEVREWTIGSMKPIGSGSADLILRA